MRRALLLIVIPLATACQATGMGWIYTASLLEPDEKATFGFVFDTTLDGEGTFSGSYHDKAMGVDLKGTGVVKTAPPPAGVQSKGGCVAGFADYESQNPDHRGTGRLFLFLCDIDGDGKGGMHGEDLMFITVVDGPYTDYANAGSPSGNIAVTGGEPPPP